MKVLELPVVVSYGILVEERPLDDDDVVDEVEEEVLHDDSTVDEHEQSIYVPLASCVLDSLD